MTVAQLSHDLHNYHMTVHNYHMTVHNYHIPVTNHHRQNDSPRTHHLLNVEVVY